MTIKRRSSDQPDSGHTEQNNVSFVEFLVAGQHYAVDILSVREIRIWSGATLLPGAQPCVRGVINLRGSIIPVVDLSQLFGEGATSTTATHIVIVVASGVGMVGLLAQSVNDIVSVGAGDVSVVPGQTEGVSLFKGLVSVEGQMLAVVSADAIAACIAGSTQPNFQENKHVA